MTDTNTKLDPTEEHKASKEPTLAKDETAKLTTDITEKSKEQSDSKSAETSEKPATEKAASSFAGFAANATNAASSASSIVKDNVFSMFGGGEKREKRVDPEDDAEPVVSSGSKAKETEKETGKGQEDEDGAPESPEVHFEPVVHLTKEVEVKTNEEMEEQTFKMRAKLFRFDRESREWKERGVGDIRLLKHRENARTRLVMRREKTHKICANHYLVPTMKLSPNVGSDRSWVWNAAADVSEGEPEAQTLAVRFGNSENANLFKEAFVNAQKDNEGLFPSGQE